MATRQEIAQIIGYLKLVYSNYAPDVTSHPNTIDVYEDLLGDLDGEILLAAVKAACKEPRAFAPTPGEIRAAAASLPSSEPWREPMYSLNLYFERKNKDVKIS